MSAVGTVVALEGMDHPFAVLREVDDWGIRALDLVGPPRRFWGDETAGLPPVVEAAVDARRARTLATPAAQLGEPPAGDDTWTARSRRAVARLWAYFLRLMPDSGVVVALGLIWVPRVVLNPCRKRCRTHGLGTTRGTQQPVETGMVRVTTPESSMSLF